MADKLVLLKSRLDAIARSLEHHPNGLGLLGLGSAGIEIDRMDQFSDLDFFAIVAPGYKQQFIDDLSWLSNILPIAWCFKNTPDGYKLLFVDGVFCEFAVFEPQELHGIPFSQGRFIWQDQSLDSGLATPQVALPQQCFDEAFLLGELLTNLYVGLCRYHRGERLSAMRFIQIYAVDRLISLIDISSDTQPAVDQDAFCSDRRVEQRHPEFQTLLLNVSQGANRSIESAQVMLDFVKHSYPVDEYLESEIRRLLVT